MYRKTILFVIISVCLLSLIGCGQTDIELEKNGFVEEKIMDWLYVNEEKGIQIEKIEGWSKDKEFETKIVNVAFEADNIESIVTILSTDKSFEEIKREIESSANDAAEVVDESPTSIHIETNRKENMRQDIYLKSENELTYIFAFMTPVETYEETKKEISSFLEMVEIK